MGSPTHLDEGNRMNPLLVLTKPFLGRPGPGATRTRQEYIPNRHLLNAAQLAYTLQRPLLLTGEPGCGKTDFAWVIADQLGRQASMGEDERVPFVCRVNSQTRAQDLLYQYDALLRLSDAQHGAESARVRDPRNYITLRELGQGLMLGAHRVVLIDEIDKAPRDLPNDLLHVVEEGSFYIPELRHAPSVHKSTEANSADVLQYKMSPDPSLGRPLIVVTSNAERHLPEPFLRRCVFFHVPPPDADTLRDIIRRRLGAGKEDLRKQQLRVYLALRSETIGLTKRPSIAELIDWVHSVYALPNPSHAEKSIQEFGEAVNDKTFTLGGGLEWADLPGLPCLIKLEEDLERLKDHMGRA